jgi:hypothetical protein
VSVEQLPGDEIGWHSCDSIVAPLVHDILTDLSDLIPSTAP